jgi:hypothetical protein
VGSGEDGVIDEPGGAGSGDLHGIERGPVDQGDVVNTDCGFGGESLAGGLDEGGGSAFPGRNESLYLSDCAAEGESLGSLCRIQIGVAGAES